MLSPNERVRHGVPPAVIAKLNKTLNQVIADPVVREHLTAAGVIVQSGTPEAFGQMMEVPVPPPT